MPPNVLAFRIPPHPTLARPHDRVKITPPCRSESRTKREWVDMDAASRAHAAVSLGFPDENRVSLLHRNDYGEGDCNGPAADPDFAARGAGGSARGPADDRVRGTRRPAPGAVAEAAPTQGRGTVPSPRPAGAPAAIPLADLLPALAILAVAACAGWVLLAYPMVREIAWGSVAALPGWVWVGAAVVFGAMAGGQVR